MTSVLRVAIPSLMPTCLDYLPNQEEVQPGGRVKISLRGRDCIGIVMSKEQNTEVPVEKLKPIIQVVDKKAVISANLLPIVEMGVSILSLPVRRRAKSSSAAFASVG